MKSLLPIDLGTRRRRFLPLLGVLFAVLLLPTAQGHAADLFTPVAEPPPSSIVADALTGRSRLVTMDLGQVARAWAAVAEPADPPAQTRGTSARPDTARAVLAPGPLLTLNLFDDVVVNGATVAGTVRLPGAVYEIRSMDGGLYAIREVDEPPLNCDVVEPHSETGHLP